MADTKTASLTVLGGPLAGQQCTLPENGMLTIGSSPDSSLYLDLLAVSPLHARVVVEAGRITVHDTGSVRTVHVNDSAIGPQGTELRNGDIVWLGAPGDEDVVMLQCILPKRPAAASPAPPPPAAAPTPEIETVALWATTPGGEPAGEPERAEPGEEAQAEEPRAVEAPPEAWAETVEQAAVETMAEPAPAFEEGVVEETGVVVDDAATPAAVSEEPELVAAVLPAGTFIDEAPAEAAPDADAYVIEESEAAGEVAPTILVGSPGEVTLEAPPEFTPEVYEPPAAPAVEATPVEEPAPTVEAHPVAPSPPAPAPPPPAAPPPAAARPARPPLSRKADWQTTRPAGPSASQRLGPSASQRQRVRPAPARAAEPHAADHAGEPAAAAPSSRRPMLLVVGGIVGVLVLGGGGFLAWRMLGSHPSAPAPRPTPLALASAPATPPPVAATPEAQLPTPTPEPVAATPPPATAQAAQAPTPAPLPTPTPRATPTPAAAARTPPPTPAGPSPEELRAQQVQTLMGQAEAAVAARQYDAALSNLDGVLRLEPGNARATSLRSDVAQRRDLARRRFVAGRTVVDSEKTRRDKAKGGLVGFDSDEKAPDFMGRIEFEMSPASGIEANDAWTLKVFVVNSGGKPIKVQGLTLGAAVNGASSALPVTTSVREIAPRQRVQVAEATGTWPAATTAWSAEATLTAPRSETLKNTLTWK